MNAGSSALRSELTRIPQFTSNNTPPHYPLVMTGACVSIRTTAAAIPQPQVETTIRAMVLYESFRPEVPKGKAGWGQSGMLRLRTVLELKDDLLREKGASSGGGARPQGGPGGGAGSSSASTPA